MRADYERLEFHRALDALLDFCTVDLSAVFLDVAKDRLYTLAAGDPARRSAQTVLWRALHDLVRRRLPAACVHRARRCGSATRARSPSARACTWPTGRSIRRRPPGFPPAASEWRVLLALREAVNAALEPMRAAKTLGSTTEASVRVFADAAELKWLERYSGELPGFLLVAELALTPEAAKSAEAGPFRVEASPADPARFKKCERCWMHRTDVSSEGLCARCREALASDVTASAGS